MSKSPNVMTNSSKALSAVLGNPAKSNSAMSSIANVATNAAQSVRTSAANSMNSIADSIKSINTSISTPLQESIASVPDSAPSLGIMLPMILIIGALVIGLTLVVYYRSIIEEQASGAYSYVKGLFTGLTTTPSGSESASASALPPPEEVPPTPSIDVINQLVTGRKQVFNVSANKYTYSDAEPLCRALGAELATYDQVKQAWNDGADWCNYGWVKGQSAVYPTQKATFDELQRGSTDDERLACGLPGINGGFFDNPELRFGVNCFGEKPAETSNDLRITNERAIPPLTADGLGQKRKELAYKAQRDTIGILPFKTNSWSE